MYVCLTEITNNAPGLNQNPPGRVNKMKAITKTFVGSGHYQITVEIDGKYYSTTTTNIMAIDAAFDDCYDDDDNSGRFYESQQEAIDALIAEIKMQNRL